MKIAFDVKYTGTPLHTIIALISTGLFSFALFLVISEGSGLYRIWLSFLYLTALLLAVSYVLRCLKFTRQEKILYILRGLPGSGKSTLAKHLVPEECVCENDAFFVDTNGVYHFNRDAHSFAVRACFNKAYALMKQDEPRIAVANVFTKKKHYRNYEKIAAKYGYRVQVFVCNGGFQNVHEVPEETIASMKECFEA